MDTSMFDFAPMQMFDNGIGYNMPVVDSLNSPLYPIQCDDIGMMDIYTFPPKLINTQVNIPTLAPVTDIFGNTRMINPMDVDIMSGMPSSEFSYSWADALQERNQAKLNDSSALEHERDLAVDKYHDAMNSGNYEEALKWEQIANSHQQEIYNLWDTPQYGLPAVAPGIDD